MMSQENRAGEEAEIRQQMNTFVKAFRTKDVNLMMSLYAPEMVAFDIVPPLQDVGTYTYRRVWEKTFALFLDPIEIETRDQHIATAGDVAFSHELLRLCATRTNGQKTDYWERMTLCFRKMDGRWLITHEHVSVPAELESGRAVRYQALISNRLSLLAKKIIQL
jgi:ketosteroid isomerase-like protein